MKFQIFTFFFFYRHSPAPTPQYKRNKWSCSFRCKWWLQGNQNFGLFYCKFCHEFSLVEWGLSWAPLPQLIERLRLSRAITGAHSVCLHSLLCSLNLLRARWTPPPYSCCIIMISPINDRQWYRNSISLPCTEFPNNYLIDIFPSSLIYRLCLAITAWPSCKWAIWQFKMHQRSFLPLNCFRGQINKMIDLY